MTGGPAERGGRGFWARVADSTLDMGPLPAHRRLRLAGCMFLFMFAVPGLIAGGIAAWNAQRFLGKSVEGTAEVVSSIERGTGRGRA